MDRYIAVCREPGCDWQEHVSDERTFLAAFSKHYREQHTDRTHVRVIEPGAAV